MPLTRVCPSIINAYKSPVISSDPFSLDKQHLLPLNGFNPYKKKSDMASTSDYFSGSAQMPPGTELMRNTTSHHMAEGPKSHQVLVPTPSNDPTDPLNWSMKWKLITAINQSLFVVFSIIPALSIAPVTPIFIQYFGATPATVSLFLGVCVITLGWANFIIIPLSNIFGQRFICLVTALIVIGSNIWQASAKNTSSFFGARALNGVGSAVNESVMVQVIADIFFLHERGLWMGVFFASYFIGLFIGPIIAGNMAEYEGWQSFFWLCTGVSVLNFLCLLLAFPETKFHRPSSCSDQSSNIIMAESKAKDGDEAQLESPEQLGAMIGQGGPGKKLWLLAQKPYPGVISSLLADFIAPVYILSFPIIVWAACMVGAAANTLLVMNLTQSPVFAAPPYLFTPGNVGFLNFTFLVGGLFGMATAGPLSDWIAKKLTIRNDDIREPEMRLLALIPYIVIMFVGVLVIILGYRFQWSWEAIVIFGYTCVGIQVVALPTIAISYAIDSYKPISGEILAISTVLKNTFGFGMSWWVPDLLPYQAVLVLFCCNVSCCLFAIPIYFFGKRLRTITSNSKIHGMEAIM
jgi:MFS family permease